MRKKLKKDLQRVFAITLISLMFFGGLSVKNAGAITLEELKQTDPIAYRAVEGLRALNLPSGTEIVFFSEEPKVTCVNKLKGELEKLTGIKVIAESAAGPDVVAKILRDAITGAGLYDIPTPETNAMADFAVAGYLYPIDEFVKKYDPELDDYVFPFNKIWTSFGGTIYGLPMDGDVYPIFYRKDLLEDPIEKANFMARYGYELKLPKTYKKFRDVLEFFTRPEEDFYGYSGWRLKGWVYNWYNHWLGAANGFYFDKNMNTLINSPAGVRALSTMKELNQFMSPGYMEKTFMSNMVDFVTGKAFCVITWGAFAVGSALHPKSVVQGKIGYGVPPGFEINGKAHQSSQMAGGYSMLISKYSKHPEAAYLVAQYMTSPSSLFQMIQVPYGSTEAIRRSTFEDPRLPTLYPGLGEFTKAQLACIEVGHPDPIIPGYHEYRSKLEIQINNCMVGKITPQEALDKAAEDWDKITQRMGKSRQRKYYKFLMEAMGKWEEVPE